MKLSEILTEQLLNEYLVREGDDLYEGIIQLNLFVDMEKGQRLSDHEEDFAENEDWMAAEEEYSKIAADLEKRLKKITGPMDDDDVATIHDVWYDGSDSYESPEEALESLTEIYDAQIDMVEEMIGNEGEGRITENVEDDQAEANEKAVTLLMMAKTFMNDDEFQGYAQAHNQASDAFSDGYERDDDNQMYGGLDDLEGVGQDLEDPVRDYFKDKYEAEFKKYSERTNEYR